MNSEAIAIPLHLFVAMVAGGLIGLERSYSGRSAGLRTHTLVCMASSLLMLAAANSSLMMPPPQVGMIKTMDCPVCPVLALRSSTIP